MCLRRFYSNVEYQECQDLLNVADFSIFLQKCSIFYKSNKFTQSNSMKAVLEIF